MHWACEGTHETVCCEGGRWMEVTEGRKTSYGSTIRELISRHNAFIITFQIIVTAHMLHWSLALRLMYSPHSERGPLCLQLWGIQECPKCTFSSDLICGFYRNSINGKQS